VRFLFPFTSFGPPQIIGALSLAVLAAAIYALYVGSPVSGDGCT
jgi:hypothetical protein